MDLLIKVYIFLKMNKKLGLLKKFIPNNSVRNKVNLFKMLKVKRRNFML
jgi:hypothetical protein